ncbi:MAG: hypothetical protein HY711_03290, partial [Candidatus Melainabacteria bacterium]|nr:hypothetical protein [Candidatus Melainabacteria bacterium]
DPTLKGGVSAERDSAVATVGIIGGGTMGVAIAEKAALAGFNVLLKEVNQERLDQAMALLRAALHRIGTKSKDSPQDMEACIQRVQPVVVDSMLAEADLIIEAVFEDLDTKAEVFCRLAQVVRSDCILATNTSSLSVSAIANRMPCKERFLGLHFFHPVDKMPLVEVILHDSTDRNIATKATAFVSRLGKTPVSVADGPGFLVNRLLCCYLLESSRVAEEGVALNWIEDAAQQFGMPMGPLTLLDEVGLDVAFQVARSLYQGCGERFAAPVVLDRLQALGVAGKKGGKGIYMWDESGKRLSFNPQMKDELGLVISEDKPNADVVEDICQRLILPMVDEAARCLEERVVRRARELDLAMVMGIGFPAFRGGLLRYADKVTMPELRTRLESIYAKSTPARTVSQLLKEMEASHRGFYSRAPEEKLSDGS